MSHHHPSLRLSAFARDISIVANEKTPDRVRRRLRGRESGQGFVSHILSTSRSARNGGCRLGPAVVIQGRVHVARREAEPRIGTGRQEQLCVYPLIECVEI